MKQFKTIAILGIVLIPILIIIFSTISLSNREVLLRNQFEQKIDQRTAFFDKMFKIISQKSQITIKNDSSFRKNVEIVMSGRKDSEGLVMKWITETNPNANYSEVSSLYRDLSRTIESQREGFFVEEKMIQDIVRQHKNMIRTFPSGFILKNLFGVEEIVYKPITSDITEEVIKTGKDNNIDLNL